MKLEGQVKARWWRTFMATSGSLKRIQKAVGTTGVLVVVHWCEQNCKSNPTMLDRMNQRGGELETGTWVRTSEKHRVMVYSGEVCTCLKAPSQREEQGWNPACTPLTRPGARYGALSAQKRHLFSRTHRHHSGWQALQVSALQLFGLRTPFHPDRWLRVSKSF